MGHLTEDQDELAFESYLKAAAAYDEGFMDDLVIPFAGVFRDNNIREDISLEKMAELKPVFDKAGGTITAANSTRNRWGRDRAARKRRMGGKPRFSSSGPFNFGSHFCRRHVQGEVC